MALGRTFRVVPALLVVAMSLGACTPARVVVEGDPPTSGSPAVPQYSGNPSASAAPAPLADLASLTVRGVTGTAPKTRPTWKSNSDVESYTLEMLRHLIAGAQKASLNASALRFAVYNGDPEAQIDCKRPGFQPGTAKAFPFAVWCPAIGALLVSGPAIKNPANTQYLPDTVYVFASAMGTTLAAGVNSRQAGCNVGLLYRGVGLQERNLEEAGRKLDTNEFTTDLWGHAIVAFLRGHCKDKP